MKFNFDELVTKKSIGLPPLKGLRDDDLDVLIDVIMQSSVLETLYLATNKLTLADGKLTNAIANGTIKTLYLGFNNIGVEGAKHLADALKVNKTLEKIDLRWNNISDEGLKHLADALKDNDTLQVIDLHRNNIGDEGAKHLADALIINKSIII